MGRLRDTLYAFHTSACSPITLDTTEMTGSSECDSKSLVTYAAMLPVMSDWKALTKYSNHILPFHGKYLRVEEQCVSW